jgi:hypothetical protein
MQAIREAATDFLAHKRIAVTGVEESRVSWLAVYLRLRARGL